MDYAYNGRYTTAGKGKEYIFNLEEIREYFLRRCDLWPALNEGQELTEVGGENLFQGGNMV